MKRTMVFAAGAAVGYVLGARAGRSAYDRMVVGWRRTSQSIGLPDLGRTVSRSAVDLGAAAKDRANGQVRDLIERTADAVARDTQPDADRPSRDRDHGTIIAPTPTT